MSSMQSERRISSVAATPPKSREASRSAHGRRAVQRNAQDLLPHWLRMLVIALLMVFILIPIGYLLMLSVTPDVEITSGHLIPTHWEFANYVKMWSTVSLAGGLLNSVIIAGSASVAAVILAVGAAYVLTRFTFLGRRPYLYGLIGLQTVPGVMLLLPIFVLFASAQTILHVRFIGTYQAVILTYLTFALPFATWLMVSYLGSIPVDLEEAALVDGATRLQALWHVIVPVALPGMVVSLVFSFLTGWNDVLFASVLTSPSTRPVSVLLQSLGSAQEGGALPLYGQLMGAAVISALPVVVLYLVFQRYLIGGLTAGGVKG